MATVMLLVSVFLKAHSFEKATASGVYIHVKVIKAHSIEAIKLTMYREVYVPVFFLLHCTVGGVRIPQLV